MTFDEILEQVVALLKRQGRVSYGALKMRFEEIDDKYLEVLKEEILYVHESEVQADDRGFTWQDTTEITPVTTSQPAQPEPQPVVEQTQPKPVESPPVEPHTPDAERRQLTVMFCDLVGSTHLSGQLDPEDLREIVRSYQAACTEVIQRYAGHIAQHLGDGLLVYFGYPQAHEDDPQRAVHTGLGILESLKNLNAYLETDRGIQLSVRVGIHTGLVVIGEIGSGSRQEQLALGETPNIAARIEGLAEPNTLKISDATYHLVEGFFDCSSLGEHDLRGVSQPQAIYRVFQESGAQNRLDVISPRGLTPLVGRSSELQLLIDRWHQVKSGEGQVVLLNAEPGLGKSRMVQALREHLVDEAYTRLECRSSPYYQNTALYPVIDLVQRTLQWHQDDSADEKLGKLEQDLSQYRLSAAEAVPLMAGLLSLPLPEDRYPPVNLTPQRQRQKTLATIIAMLLELAERQPVLFILEDLHWTDPSTIELLGLLIEQVPTSRLYALLTCRPEFQSPWSNRSYFTQITLNRLSRDGIEQMVARMTGEKPLPDEVIQLLVDKTDGVPLYVEEMTKTVLESGLLEDTNGQYELTGSISALSIPATLQDSLMARLDRLVTAKAVAQYASVIGRQFSYELLQAVSQVDEETLHKELRRLVEAELVYQRGLPPQATYIFKHALIRDSAYESLLRSTRQGYHRHIADVLVERFLETAEKQPELLAHHYTQAGLNEQAVDYWKQAGEQAIQRSANMEAVSHLTKGLEVLTTLPDTRERLHHELALQTTLGPALIATQGQAAPEVEHTYARARALCQQVGETRRLFPVLMGLWRFYIGRAEYQATRELAEQFLHLAQQHHDPTLLLAADYMLEATLYFAGELVPAKAHLERSIALYDSQQQHAHTFLYGQEPGVAGLAYAALLLWLLGYPDQSLKRNDEALRYAKELSHPENTLARVLVFAARLHQFRRDAPLVQAYAEMAITLTTEHELVLWLAGGTTMRGWALAIEGQGREGMAQICQGVAMSQSIGVELWRPYVLALQAESYGHMEQLEAGLSTLAEALQVMEQTGERWHEAELYRLKGELLLQQSSDTTTDAETCFQKAITIAQTQSAKSWELRASTSLARLRKQQGKISEAHDLLAPIYNWFSEGFDTADLIDAKALLDELA